MPTYQFRGRRYDTGAVIEGERAAQNKQNLVATLRGERIMPISINEGKKKSVGSFLSGKKKVAAADLAVFTKQFSVMLEAGMPLVQAMAILAEQQENPTLRETLGGIKR